MLSDLVPLFNCLFSRCLLTNSRVHNNASNTWFAAKYGNGQTGLIQKHSAGGVPQKCYFQKYRLLLYLYEVPTQKFCRTRILQNACFIEHLRVNATACQKPHESLKSLVTIRMNEIFPCLACYGQKLIFLFGNRDKDKQKLCERKRQR